MKSSLILSLIVSSVVTVNAHAGTLSNIKNIMGQNTTFKDVYSGVKFQYFDQTDRLKIVNEFLNEVETDYALLRVKEKRIGLDFTKLKAEAIAQEMSIASIEATTEVRSNPELRAKVAAAQAKSNMEFLDRMQLLVAKFQDSHFSVQEKIGRPMVYTGLRLRRVQGLIFVGGIDKKFMGMAEKLSGADLSAIKPGDVVLSIDGVPVEQKIEELKKYIAGSSEEFRDSQAIRSLTIRNLAYPTKNYMVVEFQGAGTYKLPIFSNASKDSATRPDVAEYLKNVGIPSDAGTIGITFDKTTRQWVDSPSLQFDGYSPWKLHTNLKGLVEYADDGGGPGMRTGYYMKNGKTYGVLQLLTFSTKNLTLNGNAIPFLDAIRGFVAELKDNGMPLILDLRNNPGGNGNFPAALLGILGKTGEVYGGPTFGYRMTSYVRQLEEPQLIQEVVAEDITEGITIDVFSAMLNDTIDSRKEHTPMYSYSPVVNDPKIKGFDNKMVVLTTADCVSACDMTLALLKASKRAPIIGTNTNGTGAGFISTSDLNTEWSDSLRVFSSRVPNHLFGRPGDPSVRIFGENSVMDMDLENQPTVADITYSPMIKDLVKNNTGWLDKAIETIENLK